MYPFCRATTKHLSHYLFVTLLLFSACAKTDSLDPDESAGDITPFVEGTIEMGVYSYGVDLGFFIKEIDFSRGDVPEQFAELAESNEAALGLVMNGVVGAYYVRGGVPTQRSRSVEDAGHYV